MMKRRTIDMARIGPSKNTRPERLVRMWLVRRRMSHRLHVPIHGLPRRSADLRVGEVLVFVHGRFWHDRTGPTRTMSAFWRDKVRRNAERDAETLAHLDRIVQQYLVIWDDDPIEEKLTEAFLQPQSRPFASSGAGRTCRTRSRRHGQRSQSHRGRTEF